jgi:hypothetical protein
MSATQRLLSMIRVAGGVHEESFLMECRERYLISDHVENIKDIDPRDAETVIKQLKNIMDTVG